MYINRNRVHVWCATQTVLWKWSIFRIQYVWILTVSIFTDEREGLSSTPFLCKLRVYPACGNSCSSGWIWSCHDWRCSRPTLLASFMEITSHTDKPALAYSPLTWHCWDGYCVFFRNKSDVKSAFSFFFFSQPSHTNYSMFVRTKVDSSQVFILSL